MSDAGEGKPVTLVSTDVEGSTELWEWDKAAMMEAIGIHDSLMRCNLSKFYGYEVSTEVSPIAKLCHTGILVYSGRHGINHGRKAAASLMLISSC